MIKTISALILLVLVAYTFMKKFSAKLRGKTVNCMSCGRSMDACIKREINEAEMIFCCENCAEEHSYIL
ncbi:MAG: hypothetical protein GKB99_05205 [Methanocellales archaeon]|nr:hypothetical protein [Methanocellales archaeon]